MALFLIVGFVPGLLAQQYCVSGAITSIPDCNGCNFKVGDPVALTLVVQPGTVTPSNFGISASAALYADIGNRHWIGDNQSGLISMIARNAAGTVPSTAINLDGGGNLTPLPSPAPQDVILAVLFTSVITGNLVAGTTLPAVLPPPSASQSVTFQAFAGGANPHFSYTGQNCASTAPPPAAPVITPGGVVPLYSSSTTIQPGSWVSIFGSNLAAAPAIWNNEFPNSLGGTSVTINGKPAYLLYVSPGQINLQAPDDTARGTVGVTVLTAGGSVSSTVILGDIGPSFSLLDGKHVAAIILRADGSGTYGGGTYDIVGPSGTSLGYKTVAAKPGDVLELFGVGFGPTNPAVPAGQVFSGAASTTNPVRLTINNVAVTPSFAGLSSAGLYQINITLPAGTGSGDVPLLAIAGGVQTPAGVVLSVQ